MERIEGSLAPEEITQKIREGVSLLKFLVVTELSVSRGPRGDLRACVGFTSDQHAYRLLHSNLNPFPFVCEVRPSAAFEALIKMRGRDHFERKPNQIERRNSPEERRKRSRSRSSSERARKVRTQNFNPIASDSFRSTTQGLGR